MDWFKGKLQDLVSGSKDATGRDARKFPKQINKNFTSNRVGPRSIGRMVMFSYDAKHKDTLPYWDALPLVLIVDYKKDGFTGLNLHYVPPLVRKSIIQALKGNLNWEPIMSDFLTRNEKSKIALNYNILRGASGFHVLAPCFKRYLFTQCRSNFMYIDPLEWEKAVMLPTEKFQKASKAKVHADSVGSPGGTVKAVAALKPMSEKAQTPIRNTTFFRD